MSDTNTAEAVLPWIHPITMGILGGFALFSGVVYAILPKTPSISGPSRRQHAVITGGSSGIGLGLARECIKVGFKKVTLIARNKVKLQEAKDQLEADNSNSEIEIISCDVTDPVAVEKAATKLDPTPNILFNNAGTAMAASCVDTPLQDYERLMKINYFGGVYLTKALLPRMKEAGGGNIVFTSSIAGQLGVFGFTAYSPTKFALRGFAEALQMEVRRDGIQITLCFPPDTDTPGYKVENEGKPRETHLISETGGLFRPETVAKTIVSATVLRKVAPFNVYFGLEGWMVSTLTGGMSPVHGLVDALCQTLLMSLLRFISLFYLWDFTRIIAKCKPEKNVEDDKKTK